MKRATAMRHFEAYRKGISIHALMKRATNGGMILDFASDDFNPRPHEEGDTFS